MKQTRWALYIGCAAVAVLVGLLVSRLLNGSNTETGTAKQPDAELVHVHGLGVNPADDQLYVATHTGLFRLDGETPVRIADRYQDTMGFTVAGEDRFLGSGHPDLREMRELDLPSLLGLIESTDAGESWSARSLSGDVDFHALGTAGGRIYGWDSTSGRLMTSTDETSWTTLGTYNVSAIAVNPDDPLQLVASTPDGVIESSDGGKAFTTPTSQVLVSVAWGSDGAVGVTGDGSVFARSDDATWRRVGEVEGEPQAMTADGGQLFVAVHDSEDRTVIHRSEDAGATWSQVFREAAG
jgi:hypothetical protein